MRYFGFAFIALAILEVTSIVFMSQWIGGWFTLFLMIVQFFIGSWMMRNIGLSGVLLAGSVIRGDNKGVSIYQLMWPLRYVFAAVLLMSPGFASDIIAGVLLLPLKGPKGITNNVSGMYRQARQRSNPAKDEGDIIEGEFTVSGEKKQPNTKNDKYIEH